MTLHYEDAGLRLWHGKNLDVLGADELGYPHRLGYHPPLIPDGTYDSIITDPPYELGFMGKGWDSSGIAYSVDVWRECLRVLKPGGHLLSFGGTRTWHRIAVAIEDAGFEVRDSIAWLYGSGFPKSMDVSKAIDKAAGADREVVGPGRWAAVRGTKRGASQGASNGGEQGGYNMKAAPDVTAPATDAAREWEGWGTALKPAFEPIIVARKPFRGTVAANVLAHGTGALNIDATRVPHRDAGDLEESTKKNRHADFGTAPGGNAVYGDFSMVESKNYDGAAGRWPTNVLLESSQGAALDGQSSGASRFFPTFRYEAKAPTSERPNVEGTVHATVKPLALMRWLVRLVTRRGGRVLDIYAGSGTTGEAALLEGCEVDLIEMEADHLPLILARVKKPLQPSMFGDWEDAS